MTPRNSLFCLPTRLTTTWWRGRKYPAVLFLTGDSDTRVAPLHARKMTAAVQAAQGGDKPILLLYDTKLGHSEGRPVSKIIEEDTQVLGFSHVAGRRGPESLTSDL